VAAAIPVCFPDVMTDLQTTRLRLHPIDSDEGQRIVTRLPVPGDVWADDYPFEGDVGAVRAFLRSAAEHGDQRPFGYYRIDRRSDGQAVGGIGFKGPPEGGVAEIGYGLVPSARGQGYAAEAVVALLRLAGEQGLTKIFADTTPNNFASQRTLVRAGFRLVRTEGDLYRYEASLIAHGSCSQ
jgi:RimJ/RimL family protein N-acetyltransferase